MHQTKLKIVVDINMNGNVTTQVTNCSEKEFLAVYGRIYENTKKVVRGNKVTTATIRGFDDEVAFVYSYLDKMLFAETPKKPVNIPVEKR